MPVSIDIVIPSFRLESKYLLPILRLQRPADAVIRFYLVVDNPAVVPSSDIMEMVDDVNIFLSINPQNMGAAYTRNKGMEMGHGNWILFLDDDIAVVPDLLDIYVNAAREHPDETGFIGLVTMPPPRTAFGKAVVVSGAMDIFTIAKYKKGFAWGATANMMISRDKTGDVRFLADYPKSGGGEDVDFFLRVREKNGYRNYRSLPEAAVEHPWWNNEAVNYQRPYRYGLGKSLLPQLNPQYAYRDFLNTPETLFLCTVATVVLLLVKPVWVLPMLLFMGGVVLIEIIASCLQAVKRKAEINPVIFMYAMLLRMAYEYGRLWGNLRRWRINGIGERFNDDGSIAKTNFYRSSSYRLVKWVLYPILIWLLVKQYC